MSGPWNASFTQELFRFRTLDPYITFKGDFSEKELIVPLLYGLTAGYFGGDINHVNQMKVLFSGKLPVHCVNFRCATVGKYEKKFGKVLFFPSKTKFIVLLHHSSGNLERRA